MKVLVVFGTRPEVLKLAPVIRACRERDGLDCVTCFTGQHRELATQAIEYFGVPVHIDLNLMQPNHTLAGLTARCLTGIDDTLLKYQPDVVVGQGDTTSVMAAALAAFYRERPFVHVEAGLRTGDMHAPWPEEFNRRSASLTAALHCAPTQWAADNLLAEGVNPASVHVTGNTIVDALLWAVERERGRSQWRDKYSFLGERPMVLVTSHRRENFGKPLEQICKAIAQAAEARPDSMFVFPVHLNPNVRTTVGRLLSHHRNIQLLDPIPYPEFVWLMDRACLLLTDSGGIQEEAPSLGKPVLVMRDSTERPEGIRAGVAELVGTSTEKITTRVIELLDSVVQRPEVATPTNPYGDGNAAARIVELILSELPA